MSDAPPPRFPDGFLWGAATSAYQIEGSPLADGAGPSNWHRWSHTPGNTAGNETGDVADDHYRRYPGDVALMHELGLAAYRFSISWSRIFPSGTGRVNPAGVGFYDRLIDLLLERGIRPNATLFHWDLPAALDERGGWLNRDSADWFADYARECARRFGDRVAMWATLNEPWVVMDAGHVHGVMAPGRRNIFDAPRVAHNLLRAHGAGLRALRAEGVGAPLGIVLNLEPKDAASDSAEDLAATARADAYINRHFLDPLVRGAYPDELREIYGEAWPEWPADDFHLIRTPLDWLGINYYQRKVTRHDPAAWPTRAGEVPQPQHVHTTLGWEVYAPALTRLLRWVAGRTDGLPLYITENGAAFHDPPHAIDGRVDDPLRIWYFREHLRAARAAIGHGVNLRGYFAWSLLDNYEWSQGYSKRFGIVHVNYATQERTPKASARFYADVIRTNGAILDDTTG